MSIQSLRDRIIAEMRQCHDDAVYTHPAVTEWGVDNELSDSKTLAEIIARGVHPEISTVNLLDWRESVNGTHDPSGGLPAGPSTGDRWISTATANGWTENAIYTWDGSTWSAFTPDAGCTVWSESLNNLLTYYSNAWQDTPMSMPSHAADHGIGGSDPVTIAWEQITSGVPVYAERWPSWSEVGSKPATFPPENHASSHGNGGSDALSLDWGQITTGRTDYTTRWPSWSEVGSKPATFPPENHASSHGNGGSDALSLDWGQITTGRTDYTTRWPNWSEVGSKPATFPPENHASSHGNGGSDALSLDWGQVTTGRTDYTTRWPNWSEVGSKPSNLITGAGSVNRMAKFASAGVLSDSIVSSGDYNITITSPTYQQTHQIQMVNGGTARSYIGQYGGHTYISNNRYYTGGGWSANDPAEPGARYIAALNGHHLFASSPSGSVAFNTDFKIDGTNGYVESHHNLRLGGNAINNNGTGGLTFDTSGEGTFSANLNVTSNLYLGGSSFATNNTSRAAIFGGQDANSPYLIMYGKDHATVAGNLYLNYGGYTGTGEFIIRRTDTGGALSTVMSISAGGSATFTGAVNSGPLKADRLMNSHLTTSSLSTGQGDWTRIARVRITAQYDSAGAEFLISGIISGSSSGVRGKVYFRVKQQNSLGNAPFVNIYLADSHRLSGSDIVAVTTQNDATATVVELYIKYLDSYLAYGFTPINVIDDTALTVYSSDGVVTSLPAGTQTDGSEMFFAYDSSNGDATAPRDVYMRNLFTTGHANIGTSLDVTGTALFGSTTGFGGRIETGGNWMSYASADNGMSVDAYGSVTFRNTDNRIKNIILENTYDSNTVRSYIGQYQDNLFICNNASYVSGTWLPDLSSDHSERLVTSTGIFYMDYSIGNSPISWNRVFEFNGPSNRAGFFITPLSTFHVHEKKTSGTDQSVFRLSTAGGGGLHIMNSDLSSASPTWKFYPYSNEGMEFYYSGNRRMRVDSSVTVYGPATIVTADGGNTHFGYSSGNYNYITHQDTGASVFRRYDTTASSYLTMVQIKENNLIQFDTSSGTFRVNSNTTTELRGRLELDRTDNAKGAIFFKPTAGNDVRLWEVGDGGSQSFGYHLDYKGNGTGDANYLELWSHNGDMLYRAHYSTGQFRIPGLFSRGVTKDVSYSSGNHSLTVDRNYIDVTSVDSGGGTSIVLVSEDNTRGDWCVIENSAGNGFNIYLDGGISRTITMQGSDKMVFCAKVADGQWYAVKMA